MSDAKSETPELPVIEARIAEPSPFLQRVDWACFGITAVLALAAYLSTICPDVELGDSGIYATGGMYLGVPDAPGFPLWTIYSYLFTALLPVSNIAWRVNVASAVASALTCGIVALLSSRCGGAILSEPTKWGRLGPKEETKLRLVCGCIAGLSLGFDRTFWNHALIAEPWNFTLLLLALTISFFLRWQHAPGQTRWFHPACFTLGLTLTSSQALFAATVGFGWFMLCTRPSLARDVSMTAAIALGALLAAGWLEILPYGIAISRPIFWVETMIAFGAFSLAVVLAICTRALFTQWRTVVAGGLSLLLGLTPYLLVPIFSMTNPPMNWGYPRTLDGFLHVISRGQYEALYPSDSIARFANCLAGYAIKTQRDFGFVYVCLATVPFLFFRRFQKKQRRCLLGLLGLFLSLSVFLVYLLNPSFDRASLELNGRFFPASHLLLSILAGCGLVVVGVYLSKGRSDRCPVS